jgi:adenylate kinase family enzyme
MSRENPTLGHRIVVWGVTGSGKTTLARRLSEALSLPRIELDALFWQPGWVETPDDEFRAKVQAAVDAAPDGWVLDGSYSRVSDIYLLRADTLIWLHLPWRTTFRRLLWRTVSRAWTREPLYYEGGPQESWRLSFFDRKSILWYSIRHHRSATRLRRERFDALPPHIRRYELRSTREVRAVIASAKPAPVQNSAMKSSSVSLD